MSEIDPHVKLYVKKEIENNIVRSDRVYAIKLVEKIVFYMVGAASITVLGALFRLVIL